MSINSMNWYDLLLMLWVQHRSDVPSKFLNDLTGSRVLHWRFAPGDPKWNQTTSWTGWLNPQLALCEPTGFKKRCEDHFNQTKTQKEVSWISVYNDSCWFLRLKTKTKIRGAFPGWLLVARPWIRLPKLMDILQLKLPIRWGVLLVRTLWYKK